MRVRDFLKANNLKQRELAGFLGVTEAAISNVVKGKSDFSKENLIKILDNPHGWDVSMLTEDQPENPVEEKPEEVVMIDKLFALIDDQRADIKMLLAMLREKDEKIDELRKELDARKKEVALSADRSSAVNAI